MLCFASIFSRSLPDKFIKYFVLKIEEIGSRFSPHRAIPKDPAKFLVTVFAEFQMKTL